MRNFPEKGVVTTGPRWVKVGAMTTRANRTETLDMADGRRIAWRMTAARHGSAAPGLVFLPGYMSDMSGSKASALFDKAKARGKACVLLDYSGCGLSGGDFAAGTLSRWAEEVEAVIAASGLDRVVLVGSSMGGWLMLLVALRLPPERLAGLVGIAAAPDFTQWGFTQQQKARLVAGQTIYEDNPYGPEPTPTHPRFWADGEKQRLLGKDLAIDCPVRLLHGQADEVVPWDLSLKVAAKLRSADVQVMLVKDGDHRLSRDADIALLDNAVAGLVGRA